MNALEIRPDKALRTLWSGICWVFCLLGLVAGAALLAILESPYRPAVIFAAAGWVVLMLIVLSYIRAFYRSLEYVIDVDSVRAKKGVFWRKHTTVPYAMVTHVDVMQGPLQRVFGIGTIHVQTAGAGGTQAVRAELLLLGIRGLDSLKSAIMEGVKSRAPSKPPASPEQREADLSEQMLEQLSAIRRLLEDRQK